MVEIAAPSAVIFFGIKKSGELIPKNRPRIYVFSH